MKDKKENIPSTQMYTRCILQNPKWEKTQLEGGAYAPLSFFLVMKMEIKGKRHSLWSFL